MNLQCTHNQNQYVLSYYQYSAGDGFQDIEGYDLFDSSKGLDLTVEKKSVPNSSFIVHATKASLPSVSEDIYPLIDMSLKGTRYMDTIDKKFVVHTFICTFFFQVPLFVHNQLGIQINYVMIFSFIIKRG